MRLLYHEDFLKASAMKFSLFFIIIVCYSHFIISTEARRRGSRGHFAKRLERRVETTKIHSSSRTYSISRNNYHQNPQTWNSHGRPKFSDVHVQRIQSPFLTLQELANLIAPSQQNLRGSLDDIFPQGGRLHLSGTVRRRRLYCRVGMGYHLEIRPNGKVVGRHRPTKHGILEIFSVSTGVVGIRTVGRMRYLCMSKEGKLYSSERFNPECEFRERMEENHFNTYASNAYSDHESHSGYYMSLTKKGKSKKSKNVNGRQVKAHWLPRTVDD